MNNLNNKTALIYRITLLIICLIGLIIQYYIISKIGNPKLLIFYFTILSNIFVLIYYLINIITKKENILSKGAILISISLTGIIYNTMLNGSMEASATSNLKILSTISNLSLHIITPILVTIDYFLFTKKGEIKKTYPLIWLLIPIIYGTIIFIRPLFMKSKFNGFSGLSKYPYPFMDIDIYGIPKIALICTVILILWLAYNYIIYFIDSLLNKKNEEN